ncbi:hypothetical protein PsYK624_166550 [Phanerochaete sordida]|uniref:Uncharacterized protein n=1 Tax=Phanerochaete sordida TaxID=48140 RepID=A0A9P3GR84_9APHY|nr:hypothetical protein PsYK624_166550 [Phanerochaete sordida]
MPQLSHGGRPQPPGGAEERTICAVADAPYSHTTTRTLAAAMPVAPCRGYGRAARDGRRAAYREARHEQRSHLWSHDPRKV